MIEKNKDKCPEGVYVCENCPFLGGDCDGY